MTCDLVLIENDGKDFAHVLFTISVQL